MSLYKPKKEDIDIFEAAKKDINLFSGYYLRSKYSGTWVKIDKPELYSPMYRHWEQEGNPNTFYWNGDDVTIHVVDDTIAFHIHHGYRFLPWQLDMVTDDRPITVCIGGFGSGKTQPWAIASIIWASILPNFTAFWLAPREEQAIVLIKKAMEVMQGTRFEELFYLGPIGRKPGLKIGNEMVGMNEIIVIPILDKPEKVKNLEGDIAIIDQVEDCRITKDFRANVRSRLRGIDPQSGRTRLAKTVYIGNSNSDDPGFLELVSVAKRKTDLYHFITRDSRDNPYLTDKQVQSWEDDFIENDEDRDMYFAGMNTLGTGKLFSREIYERNENKALNDNINSNLDRTGYTLLESLTCGIVTYETPPKSDGLYIVAADPGADNPPNRNSPCILAFEITDFPERPATLAAFCWHFAHGDPDSWIVKFREYVSTYNAIGRAYYDGTGSQRGRYSKGLQGLGAIPVMFNERGLKEILLSALSTALSESYFNIPYIWGMKSQFLKYVTKDDKIPQDIVMTYAVAMVPLIPKMAILLKPPEKPAKSEPKQRYTRSKALSRYGRIGRR